MLHLQIKKNDIFCLYTQEMSGYITQNVKRVDWTHFGGLIFCTHLPAKKSRTRRWPMAIRFSVPLILWLGVKTNVLGAKYYIYIKFVQN